MRMDSKDLKTLANQVGHCLFELMRDNGYLDDKVFDSSEAAQFLNMSRYTLYNRLDEIPHTKDGRRIRFFKSDLIKYLRRNQF